MGNLRKKISKWLILIFIFSVFPFHAYGMDSFTSYPVYEGNDNADVLYRRLNFNDISNHWAKEAIQEIAALSIMGEVTARSFQPEAPLTCLQAITVLVRVLGQEEEAQQLGVRQAPPTVRDLILLSAVDNWARGYVQVAVQRGIITPAEVNRILDLTPQQMEILEEEIQNHLNTFLDGDLTPQEIAMIEGQIRNKFQNQVAWNQPATREQVGLWVARALELQPVYGMNIKQVYQFYDWEQIGTDKIHYIEAILQEGIMSGTSDTTFAPKGRFTRGQMAQLMYNIHDRLLEPRGMTKKTGEILDIEIATQQGVVKKIVTVSNDDNTRNYISLEPERGKDILIQKNGVLGLSETLEKGDLFRYYIDAENRIVYGAVIPYGETKLKGFINFIDADHHRLILMDFDDERHLLQAEPYAIIRVNGRDAEFKDLFYGQEIIVTLKGDKITYIEGLMEEDPERHGYIPPGSRVKVGDVLSINQNQVEIKVDGQRERYRITPSTILMRNGRRANLFEIKIGDRVMLSFDDIYTTDIAQIRVEDSERHIQAVYRGTIEEVNLRNREMILRDTMVYQNGAWNPHPDQKVKLQVNTSELYDGGSQISLEEIIRAKGKEAYVAVERSYGVEGVAKLNLKQGSAVLYESKISTIRFGIGQMIVDHNSFYFHPGTIVVKDNRLVDMMNLERNQTIYLAGDVRMGTRNAAFISIEYSDIMEDRIDGSRLLVYRGRIEDISDYGVTVGRLAYQIDYLQLQNHEWMEMIRPKRFNLTEDTYIFDSELQKEIQSSHFIRSRFIDPNDIKDETLRNRVKNQYYIGKTAYFVVRETSAGGVVFEEVLALNLTPDLPYYRGNVHLDHVATAEVGEVDLDTLEMTLINVKHWNTLSKRWEFTGFRESIKTDKAVILVNDDPVDRDHLYRIREKAKVYVLKMKNVSTNDDAYIVIVEQ